MGRSSLSTLLSYFELDAFGFAKNSYVLGAVEAGIIDEDIVLISLIGKDIYAQS